MSNDYAELHPEELVQQAAALGYTALAITDECSLAGVVRAHVAAQQTSLQLIIGSEIQLRDGPKIVLLATNRTGYANLSMLITTGRRNSEKGTYCLHCKDLTADLTGCMAIVVPEQDFSAQQLRKVCRYFSHHLWIGVTLFEGMDQQYLHTLQAIGTQCNIPLVATGAVHMHRRNRRIVQDTLTAIRLGLSLQEAGFRIQANGEHHLRTRQTLHRLYPPALLAQSIHIAKQCHFSLAELRYEYPKELAPDGHSTSAYLQQLTEQGMRKRWPQGVSAKVQALIKHELSLIEALHYEPYFLTVYDIVRFARSRNILCQGRGSAANSAVCYCLGITEVDPSRMEMLFERFISKERNEPPDIDVDFEHQRREEVIQYIYQKYGRDRAGIAATVITYRPRSALRDVGKALGFDLQQVERLAKTMAWWDGQQVHAQRLTEAGFNPQDPMLHRLQILVDLIIGFPRHLSQHVGGMVITDSPLSQLVPIENAAMQDRTVIQWDKDDLDALGILKIDCLSLGMLSAIHRCLNLISDSTKQPFRMQDIPAEDSQVYRMLQQADTIGVFQIESRAQMAMLPRLRPNTFYDLVIEVAIVRPGPIQGNMVHPYLRRRQQLEPVTYPNQAVRQVLERTLGVPIFQEQVIKLAMVAAGFSAGEADQLRRAMAAWRRKGGLDELAEKLTLGMQARGYTRQFAEQIFAQIQGFGEYGFPESHAASFALLAYVSAWLKYYHPAAFTCALLNSQPMGFYAPAQLIQDARKHDVVVHPVDVVHSDWDCTLAYSPNTAPALRLGLRMIKGFAKQAAARIIAARRHRPLQDIDDLHKRAALSRAILTRLTDADALLSIAGNRRMATWSALAIEPSLPLLHNAHIAEVTPPLRPPTEAAQVLADYQSLQFSLRAHPLALLRKQLRNQHAHTITSAHAKIHGSWVQTAGIVISRQRPGSAQGVIFITLEDETGMINVVIWEHLLEQQRKTILHAQLLAVHGNIEREASVVHLIAKRVFDYSSLLGKLKTESRDFH